MDVIVKVLLAYLLGSLNGSLLVGRAFGGIDIRKEGSGNAGGTNAFRTHGAIFALLVVIIDIGKAVLAVGLLPQLMLPGLTSGLLWPETIATLCAVAVVAGHVWPIWHGFKGGKGVATLVGAYLVVSIPALGVMLAVWVLVMIASGYVGLASIAGAASAPVYFALSGSLATETFWFAVAMALLVLFTHRGNILRMRQGTEQRFRRVMRMGRP